MVAAHPDFVYINDLWGQKDRLASMTTSIETIDELTTLTGGGVFWITDTRSLPTNLSRFQMWDSAVCAFLGSCVAREYHNMDSAKAVLEDVSINNAKNVYGEPKFNLGVN